MVDEAEYMKRTNFALYEHIWLGKCKPKGIGWTFINPAWIDFAASGRVKPLSYTLMGRWAIGCDPAFQGVDLGVIVEGRGNRIELMDEAEYSDTTQIAESLYNRVISHGRFNCELGVDCVGTGMGVGDILESQQYGLSDCLNRLNRKDKEYQPPEAPGMTPVLAKDFDCWRSQAWWQFRCDLEAGNIDFTELSKHESWPLVKKEILAHQMTRLNGKIRITPKDQLRSKDVLGWSPGRADAIVAWNWVRKRVDSNYTKPEPTSKSFDYGISKQDSDGSSSSWIY